MTNRYDYNLFFNFYNRYKYKCSLSTILIFCLNRYCIGDTAQLWLYYYSSIIDYAVLGYRENNTSDMQTLKYIIINKTKQNKTI